jgi:hypothetical protein
VCSVALAIRDDHSTVLLQAIVINKLTVDVNTMRWLYVLDICVHTWKKMRLKKVTNKQIGRPCKLEKKGHQQTYRQTVQA